MSRVLADLITPDRMVLNHEAADWREAIATAAQPLVDQQAIEPDYVDAMIASVEEFGPYMVLVPHVALAHAKPGGLVHEQCFSILTLKEPVAFHHPDNDPVQVVFCLGAPDKSSHLGALKSFVRVASAPAKVAALVAARTADEVDAILRE